MESNGDIIGAIKRGDKSILNTIYATILPQIKLYVVKNGGSDDEAKDIFQDTIMIFVRQVLENKYNDNKGIPAYMYTIARNLWINKAKKDKRMLYVDELSHNSSSDANILNHLELKEKRKTIDTVMQLVGEKCSQLLKATLYEDKSHKEVVEELGYTNTNMVKTYVMRCKKKLISILNAHPQLREQLQE